MDRSNMEDAYAAHTVSSHEEVIFHIVDGVIIFDSAGDVHFANPAAKRLLGLDELDLPPDQWAENFTWYKSDGVTPLPVHANPMECARRAEAMREFEAMVRAKSGLQRFLTVNVLPLTSEAGDTRGAVLTMHDITLRRRLDQQSQQTKKMEAIGQLAGGLAHDFNNVLAVVIGNLQLLERKVDDRGLQDRVRQSMEAAERGAELAKRLLSFARVHDKKTETCEVRTLIHGMSKLIDHTIRDDIELNILTEHDVWPIKIDVNQFESAILNLAINARDAMPHGGRLTIEAHNVTIDKEFVRQNPDLSEGDYVRIAVTDSGVGMDLRTQARIFEPFFSTKPQGKGTGLGLSTVYGFMKRANGHVKVYSEPGVGTSFKLYFLRAERVGQSPSAEIEATPKYAVAEKRRRILIVEDDAAVRAVTHEQLVDMGHCVVTTSNGREAKALLEGERFDILLSDVVMPEGVSGPDLARYARLKFPGMKVLLMSGYAEGALFRAPGIDETFDIIQKPFGYNQIKTRLESL